MSRDFSVKTFTKHPIFIVREDETTQSHLGFITDVFFILKHSKVDNLPKHTFKKTIAIKKALFRRFTFFYLLKNC